jgi:hypothetical protein
MASILYLHVRTKLSTGGKLACGIRELYATPFICVIPLGELPLKLKTISPNFNSSRPIQLDYFQADLIWCDGTFNISEMNFFTGRIQVTL